MALTVTLTQVDSSAIANQATKYVVTIASDAAAPVSLQSLDINIEGGNASARIEQPNFLVPQMPVGLGNPSIPAAGSVSYGFRVVWNVPRTSGPSPQTLPGAAGMMVGQPALPSFVLQARAATSDGSSGFCNLTVPVLSAVPIFPKPEGGALVFTQGANANLIAVI